ncbi:unnamed protein product [Owenia fusiformis]|uniref:Uncharacterized protein n=1 Tax=Owenia fusiformis TaxID=6347 RepID=A0A8J1XTP9_OWEFU|nr:unnamed protein product [Owenia fusiformis]
MDSSKKRSSERLHAKSRREFHMPTREDVLGKIQVDSNITPEKSFGRLKPRKLVNDYTRVNSRYCNLDDEYSDSDSSLGDFIVEEEAPKVAKHQRKKSKNLGRNRPRKAQSRRSQSRGSSSESTESENEDQPEIKKRRGSLNKKGDSKYKRIKRYVTSSDSSSDDETTECKTRKSVIESSSDLEEESSTTINGDINMNDNEKENINNANDTVKTDHDHATTTAESENYSSEFQILPQSTPIKQTTLSQETKGNANQNTMNDPNDNSNMNTANDGTHISDDDEIDDFIKHHGERPTSDMTIAGNVPLKGDTPITCISSDDESDFIVSDGEENVSYESSPSSDSDAEFGTLSIHISRQDRTAHLQMKKDAKKNLFKQLQTKRKKT